MAKKLLVLGVALIMCMGLFTACGDTELKQGVYTTDDGMVQVELHGENEFALQILIMSHLPTGKYDVKKGKLILHYTPDDDLVFEIGNDKLTYLGFDENSNLVEEWVIPIGAVLNFQNV